MRLYGAMGCITVNVPLGFFPLHLSWSGYKNGTLFTYPSGPRVRSGFELQLFCR